MAKLEFDPRVFDRVRNARDRMEMDGVLVPTQLLQRYLDRFRDKYGPDVLASLQGRQLLEAMHGRRSRDSLVYWLEFKNDDEFAAPRLGSISGGSALKFLIYEKADTGAWVTGSSRQQKVISVDEAIEMAHRQRAELLAGAAALAELGPPGTIDPEIVDFESLDERLRAVMPTLYGLGWSHKYLGTRCTDPVLPPSRQ